jgi:hypothetical protein
MNAINPLDPTFGAIEHHRLRSSALNDVAFAPEPDRDAYEAAYAAEEEALDALCCTPPTTAAGARAGIEYAITVEDFHGVPVARAYLANLLASPILPCGGDRRRACRSHGAGVDGDPDRVHNSPRAPWNASSEAAHPAGC